MASTKQQLRHLNDVQRDILKAQKVENRLVVTHMTEHDWIPKHFINRHSSGVLVL